MVGLSGRTTWARVEDREANRYMGATTARSGSSVAAIERTVEDCGVVDGGVVTVDLNGITGADKCVVD